MTTPQQITDEARTWLGTRFHHQGRVKRTAAHKGGCDCLGLIAGVAAALDLRSCDGQPLTSFDSKDYGREPDGGKLRSALAQALCEIPVADIRPADVLLFRFEEEPQHVGLLCHPERSEGSSNQEYPSASGLCPSPQYDNFYLIHCYASARKVVEHRLDELWRSRIVAAYRFPQLTTND